MSTFHSLCWKSELPAEISLPHSHLRSKQEDPSHELPAALEPTTAQAIMPHDSRIDAILWPAMRDRLIFGGRKIDLDVVLQSLESGEAVVVHAIGVSCHCSYVLRL